MPVYERRSPIDATARQLFEWHRRDGALPRLTPPFQPAELLEQTGSFEDRRVVLKTRVGRLVARHSEVVDGRSFVDTQEEGIFRSWRHEHIFEDGWLTDRITFEPPLGLGASIALGQIEPMFEWRHRVTAEDLARHKDRPPLRIGVTGASGLLGGSLMAFLSVNGHQPRALARGKDWNPETGEVGSLEGLDAVVHLAGENIGEGRWTDEKKRQFLDSRVKGTSAISKAVARDGVKVLVAASAVGFYGDTGDREVDEDSPAGTGFLPELCQAWEAAAAPAPRCTRLRIGVVLSRKGGALAKLYPAFLAGGGGPVGSGLQYQPNIHIDDVLDLLLEAAGGGLPPVVNAVASSIPQGDFARALGRATHRPAVLPLPAFAVKLGFGEMGERLLLEGQRVRSKVLAERGWRFRAPTVPEMLAREIPG